MAARKQTNKGFTKYSWKTDEEREYILRLFEKGHTDLEIARRSYWPIEDVRDLRVETYPTCGLAKYYLKSQALKMAKRIVEEGNVAETIDVLSRTNIGVLAPRVNAANQVKASFLTSINPADLGGVKVAAQMTVGTPAELPEAEVEPELRVPASIVERQQALPPKPRARKQKEVASAAGEQ